MNATTNPLNGLPKTLEWFKAAKPNPTAHDLQVQVGVHIEEIGEFLTELKLVEDDFQGQHLLGQSMLLLDALANHLKKSQKTVLSMSANVDTLDSICDQLVTGVGVAYMLGVDVVGALDEVNRSNFSKFDENGNPVILASGKIGKHIGYTRPQLEPFLTVPLPVIEQITPDEEETADSAEEDTESTQEAGEAAE